MPKTTKKVEKRQGIIGGFVKIAKIKTEIVSEKIRQRQLKTAIAGEKALDVLKAETDVIEATR